MLFWIVAALIAIVVTGLVVLALVRGGAGEEPAAAYDLRVYRDQLKEIDRDLARGIIAPEDAERMKTEISRRVLEADRALARAGKTGRDDPAVARIAAAGVAVVAVAGALWLYQRIGVPGYGDLPMAQRIEMAEALLAARPSQAEAEETARDRLGPPPEVDPRFAELMERLRAVVAERPNDIQGLELLARNEAATGNPAAGAAAQRRLVALKGETATAHDFAALADLMVLAAGGLVTAEAEAVLNEVLARDGRNGTARYYVGLMMAQNGRPDRAFRIWDELLKSSDPNAPWVPVIMTQMDELSIYAGQDWQPPDFAAAAAAPPVAAGPGPTAEDMEAAAEMSDEDRAAMIRGMVDGLAERLATEGGTAEDWARLIGALGVLGEADRAAEIWAEAQGVFGDHPEMLATVRAAAERAGVAE